MPDDLNMPSTDGSEETASTYCNSPAFTEAVNASRFVKTFGIIALVSSVLFCLKGAVIIGIGLFIMRYENTRFYRLLGLSVIILSVIGWFAAPITFISSAVLTGAIAWKGKEVLDTLAKEGHQDPDWAPTRKRAMIGTIASVVGLAISSLLLALTLTGMALQEFRLG